MSAAISFGLAPSHAALLRDPLGFLAAEHRRQRAVLGHLERLARAPRARTARAMAAALLRWLAEELPLHIADEEQSLHPRLRRHEPAVVERLAAGQRRDAHLAAGMATELRALAAGRDPGIAPLRDAADFARLHRHRLALEEETVIPLSRRLLTNEETAALAAEMAQRRGLEGGKTSAAPDGG